MESTPRSPQPSLSTRWGRNRSTPSACPASTAPNTHETTLHELARRTGLNFREIPIAPVVNAFLGSLTLTGLSEENLQARVRGTTLMGISNEEGHLVVATGNKSELVGRLLNPLRGCGRRRTPRSRTCRRRWCGELARWRNDEAESQGQEPPIPPSSITKAPSAELRPGQLDSDSLPDYAVLDDVLDDYVEQDQGAAILWPLALIPALVERLVGSTDRAEYKRRQYPPGPKISFKAFGRDRRLPITNSWREFADPHRAP